MTSRFPRLFPTAANGYASVQIIEAFSRIKSAFKHGSRLLESDAPDALRLKIAADNLANNALPLLEAMRIMDEVPTEWRDEVEACVNTQRDKLLEGFRNLQLGEDANDG